MEARLSELTVELQRSNRDLEEFAYVASHDLKEPLRKVQAFGERLERKYGEALEGQGRDYVARMRSAAARMQSLIDDLLVYSRMTSKGQPFSTVDMGKIAQGVVGDLEQRISDTGAQVEIGTLPPVDSDPVQMRQLLQNLIGNALTYRRQDVAPLVKVEGEFENDEVVLRVSDNGIGFEPRFAEQIFDIFERLHSREEYEGTGIGLALCKKIIHRHGGSITAEGRPGEGGTFTVRLPKLRRGQVSEREAA